MSLRDMVPLPGAAGEDEPLRPVRGFLFDVDGTLLLSDRSLGGYTLLPGAAETLQGLHARRVPFVAFTNGSAYPPAEQAAKLRATAPPPATWSSSAPASASPSTPDRRHEAAALHSSPPAGGEGAHAKHGGGVI